MRAGGPRVATPGPGSGAAVRFSSDGRVIPADVGCTETSRTMPKPSTVKRARRDARQGKKPTTQAGEFVREEMKKLERGSGNVRSRKQAIAIGLSEARRAGVPLGTPKRGKTSAATRKKARRDTEVGQGRRKPSPTRSRGAKKAARTRARRHARRTS